MSNRIVSVCGWLILLFAVTVITGCSNESNPTQSSTAVRADNNHVLPEAHGIGERDALRLKADTARNRLWVLGLDNVRVYDTASKRLIRKISLPNWSTAHLVCPPDMALDPSGPALVSSNAQPRLARIDASSFELTEYEIRLHEREQWDTGFGALVFGKDGALFAATSSTGSLWKIDLGGASARMVKLNTPLLNACTLTTASEGGQGAGTGITSLCIGRDGNRRIEISSDFVRGRVADAPCNNAQR
jgi:hypothetical protein